MPAPAVTESRSCTGAAPPASGIVAVFMPRKPRHR